MASIGTRVTRFVVAGESLVFNYLQSWDDNFTKLQKRSRALPGAHGAFDEYGGGTADAQEGRVNVEYYLRVDCADDMTEHLDALRRFSRLGKGKLFMQPANADESERFCYARLLDIQDPHNYDAHTEYHMRVQLRFAISDPHWFGTSGELPTWGGGWTWGGGATWGGNVQSIAASGTFTAQTITATGNAPSSPIISVIGGTGGVTSVMIRRFVDGTKVDEVKYDAAVDEGETLVINTKAMSVTLDGADAFTTDFTYLRLAMLELQPGDNDIRVYLGSGEDATVTISDTERYV